MWNLKKRQFFFKKTEPEVGGGQMGERGQKVPISSYKMSKFWGYNVQHGGYS